VGLILEIPGITARATEMERIIQGDSNPWRKSEKNFLREKKITWKW
jgi:hypothetical protein